jgi:hypothetical protein
MFASSILSIHDPFQKKNLAIKLCRKVMESDWISHLDVSGDCGYLP